MSRKRISQAIKKIKKKIKDEPELKTNCLDSNPNSIN